jgi:hypothetical protein
MFVLSYTLPPVGGAKYGKARTLEIAEKPHAIAAATEVLVARRIDRYEAERYALALARKDTGTNWVHTATGIVFRIDPADRAPNSCPCCGRLVLPGDHALAGTEDAYCLGCFTWKRGMAPCSPHESAHANPWTTSTKDARWCMEVVIDRGDETDSDYRYTADKSHEMWDAEDNALIAWPGLTREQILSVTITEISKEN